MLKRLNVKYCYIFSFPIGQGTFLHFCYWVLSEIFHFRTILKNTVSACWWMECARFLVPGFLFTSDDVNRDVVLAGFSFLINFSLALTVSITP